MGMRDVDSSDEEALIEAAEKLAEVVKRTRLAYESSPSSYTFTALQACLTAAKAFDQLRGDNERTNWNRAYKLWREQVWRMKKIVSERRRCAWIERQRKECRLGTSLERSVLSGYCEFKYRVRHEQRKVCHEQRRSGPRETGFAGRRI
jgi:hypothetical protein